MPQHLPTGLTKGRPTSPGAKTDRGKAFVATKITKNVILQIYATVLQIYGGALWRAVLVLVAHSTQIGI